MAAGDRVRPNQFFRQRLLRITDLTELRTFLGGLRREGDELMEHIHSIMHGMRGSLSREEAWSLTPKERKNMLKQIEERVKLTEKTGLALI